jgi:hypothetical protein
VALGALRQVVLVRREAVIDQQRGAAVAVYIEACAQHVGQRRTKPSAIGCTSVKVALPGSMSAFGSAPAAPGRRDRSRYTNFLGAEADAALAPASRSLDHQLHRHRVSTSLAQHDAGVDGTGNWSSQ